MPKGVDRSKTPTGKTHVLGPGEITIAVKTDVGRPGKPGAGVDAKAGEVKFLTRAQLAVLEKIEALHQEARESSPPQATPADPDPSQATPTAPAARREATDADSDACIKATAAASPDGKTSRNDLRKKAPGWYRDNGIIFDKEPDWSNLLEAYPELRRGSGPVKRA